jgi:GTP-binding protein
VSASAVSGDAPFTDEEIEAARVLFAGPAAFVMGAAQIQGLPPADQPEVAFAGRSNVGKSSLINALLGRKDLARASNTPGRTREVNFFSLDERLRLVDLPGYGFAKAARTEVKKFQNLGRSYLRGRPNLKRAYLLIDARHGLKDVDEEAMAAFDVAAVSYQIVLTKADKIKASELAEVIEKTKAGIAKRAAAYPEIIVTSSETGLGIDRLRAAIATLADS